MLVTVPAPVLPILVIATVNVGIEVTVSENVAGKFAVPVEEPVTPIAGNVPVVAVVVAVYVNDTWHVSAAFGVQDGLLEDVNVTPAGRLAVLTLTVTSCAVPAVLVTVTDCDADNPC